MPRSGLASTRANARVLVLRGFDPNAPSTLTQSLPVPSGVTVLSGQVVTPSWTAALGSQAWILGCTATVPYIALQDSADEDVSEAGKLTGLSCAGQFEIQTAFYNSTTAYTQGALLRSEPLTGDVQLLGSQTGANICILGHVTRIPTAAPGTASAPDAPFTVTTSYTGGTGSATGPGAIFYRGSNSGVTAPETVLTFATTWTGAKVSL